MVKQPEHIPFYLSDNIAVLAEKNKRLASILDREPGIPDTITIYKTKTEMLTMKYKDVLLHSLYDPEREALQFVHSQNIEKESVVLVYGFGLAYHVHYLLEAVGEGGKVFCLEPNLDILKAAFTLLDIRSLLEDPRFYIISGDNEESVALRFLSVFDRQLKNIDSELKKIIIHNASFQCLPEGFEQLQNTFEMLLIDRRTPEVFERVNIVNIRANIETVLRSPGISTFFNIFQAKPAFFINAGPSLDEALPFLPAFKEKAILFCCDTALSALVDVDIIPDFVLTVDPQERSENHFINYFDCEATLIFTPTSARSVLARYKGKKIVMLQKGHSITRHFENILSYKGFTEAGSSVSCIGLDLLMQLGCDPLIFVGMDYSFPGGKIYSSNVAGTKKWFAHIDKLNTIESMHRSAIHDTKVITIKNKYGEDIPTYQTLYAYLRQIEALITEHPDVRFYNFLSHGARIEGAEDIFLREELALVLSENIDKRISVEDESIDGELKDRILQTVPIS